MNVEQALKALRELGTDQNRKVYSRHGVKEPMLGVSYANLALLKKRLNVDHDLAIGLWESGIHDARVLATMVADPAKSTLALLNEWSRDLENYVLTDALSKLVARSSEARQLAAKWVGSEDEWVSSCGWSVYVVMAMEDPTVEESELRRLIERIERDLKTSKNRVRHAMNNTLIAIRIRSDELAQEATAAARRIGKVEVDHGETGCKTPEAGPYIKKARERAQAKQSSVKSKTPRAKAKPALRKKAT